MTPTRRLHKHIFYLKDDGWAHVKYFNYPLPPSHLIINVTSEYNNEDLMKNYNAEIT